MGKLIDIPGYARAYRELLGILRRHARLLLLLTRREIVEPHAGQLLGAFWVIGHPLFLLAVYTAIFNLIFRAHIGGSVELPLDYTAYVLSGLVPWMAFQQGITKGVSAIVSNATLVKQQIFPVEVLPLRSALSSGIVLILGVVFLTLYDVLREHAAYWTFILIVPIALLQLAATAGLAFVLSSLGVFLRDVREMVQLFCVVNIYLMPAIYLPSMIPPPFRPLLYANPFSYVIWCYQDALYFGRIEHPWAWAINIAFSLIILVIGYRLFRKLKPMFGNVL